MRDLISILQQFYEVLPIPFSIYDSSMRCVCSAPKTFTNLLQVHQLVNASSFTNGSAQFPSNPGYCVSVSGAYFGFIRVASCSCSIILGPVFDLPVSKPVLRDFLHEFALPSALFEQFMQTFAGIPQIFRNRFFHYLTFLHFLCNHELLNSSAHFASVEQANPEPIQNKFSQAAVNARENSYFHNSYQFEQAFLSCIEEGAVERLKNILSNVPPDINIGTIGDSSLRNAQNLFIASTTMVTRAAIRGGMNIEDAYQLSDLYIRESEQMHSAEDVSMLSVTAMLDFARHVHQSKVPKDMSPEIFKALQFITSHTNSPLHVDDVAKHLGVSRSTLSRRFHQELGFDVSSFIMRAKLEEAKSLLIYSDRSLSEISSYLCFSSQSYFQNVFKKKFGMTPLDYRRKGPHA